MRDSDWSRKFLLRSDWLVPKGAISTTVIYQNRTKTSGILPLANNVNFLACILVASDWFENNQLLSQHTDAHYQSPFTVIQLFNYVYLPFNDVSICQAIMVAFHFIMFHYHYHQLFLFRHLISYVCCSFNFNCERFEPRSHFIPVGFDLVSKKLFYHYQIRTRAKHISSKPFRIRIFLFFSTSCRNYQ